MQIYKLFGSLQYKVVKISHTLGNFYNSGDFTYIKYTKKAVSKSQQPKRNGSVALNVIASKKFRKKFPSKKLLPHQKSPPEKIV